MQVENPVCEQNNTFSFYHRQKKFQVSTQKVLHAHSFNFQMYMKQLPKNFFLRKIKKC